MINEDIRADIERHLRRNDVTQQLREIKERKARREELATMLLAKLVEHNGGRGQYDIQFNTRAAVEYTDALLAELEKAK